MMRFLGIILVGALVTGCDDGGDSDGDMGGTGGMAGGSGGAPVGGSGGVPAGGSGGMPMGGSMDSGVVDDMAIIDMANGGMGGAMMPPPVPAAYAQCAGCHAPDGSGTAVGPGIQNPVAGSFEYWTRTGRDEMREFNPAMPGYGSNLSDTDLAEIFDWLAAAPKPEDPQGLYMRFCANCHGADGGGGWVGQSIRGEAGESAAIIRSGHGGENYSATGRYMPAWDASALTDDEVAKIVTFVESL